MPAVNNFPGVTPAFQPTAQFLAPLTMHIVDTAVYAQIHADFYPTLDTLVDQGLVPVGMSPETLRHKYNLNWVNNPTPADYQNLLPNGCVFTWTGTAAGQILGHAPAGNLDGVQIQTGVDYTDANGQHFTEVTWEWAGDLQFFTVGGSGSPVIWDQQVVQWTGDNAATRVIPTSFALDDGANVAVLAFPLANLTSPQLLTTISGGTILARNPADATQGVITLGATGFTIATGGSVNINTVGTSYYAIVLKSGTATPKMKFGTYLGKGALSGNGVLTLGGTAVTLGFTVAASDVGRSFVIAGSQTTTIATFIDATHITIADPSLFNGLQACSIPAGGPPITIGGTIAPQMLWVFNRTSTGALYTSDMPAGTSVGFANESKPTNDMITSVTVDPTLGAMFTLGADNNVSINGQTGWWISFQFDVSDPILGGFKPVTGTGTGGSSSVTGLGFTPALVYAREGVSSSTKAAHRGPVQTGAHSQTFDGADIASTGIVSLDADGFTSSTNVAGAGNPFYGFAVKATNEVLGFPTPTVNTPTCVPNGDGTNSCIDSPVLNPITDPNNPPITEPVPAPQWWCNSTLGEALFQIESPGPGWVACVGPTSKNGWYLSGNGFGGNSIIVSAGRPADPRPWSAIATWSTVMGGSPQASCLATNVLLYPASGYVVGTDAPPVRMFDGRADRELLRIPPPTAGGAVVKAVLSMLAANTTVYCSTWDSGTSDTTWSGRVMRIDPTTGNIVVLGTAFAAGEMPYALGWYNGKLWCGTNNGIGTVGKVYWIRPGIDTVWTLDHDVSSDLAGAVASLAGFNGNLYVGTVNAAGDRGKVLKRTPAGVYSISDTTSGGAAVLNNGFLQLTVFNGALFSSEWINATPKVSKVRAFDGTTWTDAFSTPLASVIRPFIVLPVENNELYAIGGSGTAGIPAQIAVTANGTAWTELTSELPETDTTLLPMFGAVVV